MVYLMSYRPIPDSYPHAESVDRDVREAMVLDTSPDGGLRPRPGAIFHSGRPFDPQTLPTVYRWNPRRKLLDYETALLPTVSERFRDLIEQLEPGTHRFFPVDFVSKSGETIARRFILNLCNRLDSVHRGKTQWVLSSGVLWRSSGYGEDSLFFDLAKIGACKFWFDKHIANGPFITAETKEAIESAAMTGPYFKHFNDA